MKILNSNTSKYKPKNKYDLCKLIEDLSIKLWEIDTSLITDMSYLFADSNRRNDIDFEGIEFWDTSKVKNMSHMFHLCNNFNRNINNWNVSSVNDMSHMFDGCKSFNQPLDMWDVSNVSNMSYMFNYCSSFNRDISNWKIIDALFAESMFEGCYALNQDFRNWSIHHVLANSMFNYTNVPLKYRPRMAK